MTTLGSDSTMYILHTDQQSDDVRWSNSVAIDSTNISVHDRGYHFLYCFLFCDSSGRVDVTYFDAFKQKLEGFSEPKEKPESFYDEDVLKHDIKAIHFWNRLQLQFLVESRLMFTAYNVANSNEVISERDIVILAPAIYSILKHDNAYTLCSFLKFDNDKALFTKDKSSKALRLLCEYIIFASARRIFKIRA